MKFTYLGIHGLDEHFGKIPLGSIILLLGTPGSGNDIFAMQSLYIQAEKGKRTVYLNLDYSQEDIVMEMAAYGWSIEKVRENWTFLDAYNKPEEEVEKIWIEYLDSIVEDNWTAIDTLNTLMEVLGREETDKRINELRRRARKNTGIHYIIMMKGEEERRIEQQIKRYVDGVIEFKMVEGENKGVINVEKMKRRKGTWLAKEYRLTDRGIVIETVGEIR